MGWDEKIEKRTFSFDLCVDRKVLSKDHVLSGVKLCSKLADDDLSGLFGLEARSPKDTRRGCQIEGVWREGQQRTAMTTSNTDQTFVLWPTFFFQPLYLGPESRPFFEVAPAMWVAQRQGCESCRLVVVEASSGRSFRRLCQGSFLLLLLSPFLVQGDKPLARGRNMEGSDGDEIEQTRRRSILCPVCLVSCVSERETKWKSRLFLFFFSSPSCRLLDVLLLVLLLLLSLLRASSVSMDQPSVRTTRRPNSFFIHVIVGEIQNVLSVMRHNVKFSSNADNRLVYSLKTLRKSLSPSTGEHQTPRDCHSHIIFSL